MRIAGASFRARLTAVVVGGVALRVLYLAVVVPHTDLGADAFFYREQARLLADGRGLVDAWLAASTGALVPSAMFPPGWTLLLAPVAYLTPEGETALRLVGVGCGAATIALVGLVGRRLGGARIGLLAAALVAVAPTQIASDGSLMGDSAYTAAVAAAVLLALRAAEDDALLAWAALGLAIGGAALVRTEGLLVGLLLLGPASLHLTRRVRADRRRVLLLPVAAAMCAVLVLAPWFVRNERRLGSPMVTPTNSATMLAGANCDGVWSGRDIGL